VEYITNESQEKIEALVADSFLVQLVL